MTLCNLSLPCNKMRWQNIFEVRRHDAAILTLETYSLWIRLLDWLPLDISTNENEDDINRHVQFAGIGKHICGPLFALHFIAQK